MITLACSSHLLVDLPLFGGPVAFVIGAVLMIRRSERRRSEACWRRRPANGRDRPWRQGRRPGTQRQRSVPTLEAAAPTCTQRLAAAPRS